MKKILTLGLIYGLFYLAFEIVWTAVAGSGATMTGLPYAALVGKSSLYMFPVGAALGILLGLFNERPIIRKNCNVFTQALLGTVIITAFELIAGLILNVWLGFWIWDYRILPLHFLGQICVPVSIMWFLLNPFIFWLDDVIKFFLYKQGSYYKLSDVYKDLFKITKKTSFQE